MEYGKLVEVYEKLEKTTKKLEKRKILADFFRKVPDDELYRVVLLVQGIVFPKYTGLELGLATQMMIRAISLSTGFSTKEVEEKFKETGDLGSACEELIKKRKQVLLFAKTLTVEKVFENMRKIAQATGPGSQDRKIRLVVELLNSAKPREGKYIVRTILGELRVGVAEGLVRDSIAYAFLVPHTSEEKAVEAVDYAWNVLSDFGEVAVIAKEKGLEGLLSVKPVLGRPIQVMLGVKAESIEEVLRRHPVVICEFKYDGLRIQAHKKGNEVWLFTRRQEDVTKQFPDLVSYIRDYVEAEECIIEGEAWPIDKETGKPLPFQKLSQRIQRKYDIEKMMKEIPVQLNLFDVTYLNGEVLFEKPLKERRATLEKILRPQPMKIQVAEGITTGDLKVLEEFYHKALELKQEGIMLKNPESKYMFGRHIGGWYKIKPTMETLDLVIVGAEWGEGARAKWLSSYVLAVRDPDTGEFLTCGMMGTGLTEEQFEEMTQRLKPLIIKEEGRMVWVRPEVVVEVSYQEIQKSPKYTSGYALRFPRLVRVRLDKAPEEADTIQRLEMLFKSQGKFG